MTSTTCNVLLSASAAQPAKESENGTAGQTAGDSDCYKLAFCSTFLFFRVSLSPPIVLHSLLRTVPLHSLLL